mgnify:CR=1 FL=1
MNVDFHVPRETWKLEAYIVILKLKTIKQCGKVMFHVKHKLQSKFNY